MEYLLTNKNCFLFLSKKM